MKLIRDTARYPPLMRPAQPGRKPRPRALRHLAFEELGLGIQEGEHSPVEDARSALYLYQKNAKVRSPSNTRPQFYPLHPSLAGVSWEYRICQLDLNGNAKDFRVTPGQLVGPGKQDVSCQAMSAADILKNIYFVG